MFQKAFSFFFINYMYIYLFMYPFSKNFASRVLTESVLIYIYLDFEALVNTPTLDIYQSNSNKIYIFRDLESKRSPSSSKNRQFETPWAFKTNFSFLESVTKLVLSESYITWDFKYLKTKIVCETSFLLQFHVLVSPPW